MATDNSAVVSALMEQIAAMQKQLMALLAAPAPAPVPTPVPAPAPVAKAAALVAPASSTFVDSQGVEWIAEGIRRWNGPVDQLGLLPPVPLPAGGHRGWWSSGDPYKHQQRDSAYLSAEMRRIDDEWKAKQPPPLSPKVYPAGSRG